MSVVISSLPEKEKGHWKVIGFPYFHKYNDEYYTKMEIAHEFYDTEKNNYTLREVTIVDVPLKMLMDIKIDDHFDCKNKTKTTKKGEPKYRSVFFDKKQHQLMAFDYNRFKKFKTFHLSEKNNGNLYYEFPYNTFEKQNDTRKRNVILPSIVVAQAFYFLDSTLIEMLFENNLRDILKFYSNKNIIEQENKKIGFFVYNNTDTSNPIKEQTAKSVANFLFSHNDFLLNELKMANSNHYYPLISNQKVQFNFPIPIRSTFKFKVYGEYYSSDDEVIFYVNEIFYVEKRENPYEVDEIKTVPKIDRSSTDKRDEKEEIIGGNKTNFRKPSLQKPKISTDRTPNSKLGEIDLNQKASIFNFIKISSQKKEDQTSKYSPESTSVIDQTEITSYNNAENNESDVTKANNSQIQNKTSEQRLSYLLNIMERIKSDPNLSYEIRSVKVEEPSIYKIFRIINSSDENIYFIEDIYHDRIQVLSKETLKKLEKDYFFELLELHKVNLYSWDKLKKNNKKSYGALFHVSVNKQLKDKEIKKGYENILKRIKSAFNEY